MDCENQVPLFLQALLWSTLQVRTQATKMPPVQEENNEDYVLLSVTVIFIFHYTFHFYIVLFFPDWSGNKVQVISEVN